MSLLGKPIEDVIETLYNSIKSKREIITNLKNEYNIDNDTFNDIKINRFKLIELLDEFEVTISQSLQAIQTFKVEIFNLKEKQATEEILNLTNEFQMKYNSNEKNNINNNNILNKLEYGRNENSFNAPKNEFINNSEINDNKINNNNKQNINNLKEENAKKDNNNNKEFNVLKEAKLNFDYSNLLNNSESSLKASLSNMDNFKLDNKFDNNKPKKNEDDLLLNNDLEKNKLKFNQGNIQLLKDENTDIDMINNNLNKEDIEEEQPSKLNINIIRSNNDVINKKNIGENINSNSNKDISCFSENFDYLNSNNNNNNYSNKFFSMRQSDIYNINNNQSFNYKFNLLNNNSTNNKKENEKIETNNYIYDNNNNFEESDIISLVSKNDVIKEKFQKLENDEKINKLIEEIFSIKAFKLYILDKFGNGKQDIFFKKIKNGEINKDELESELNLLKEIYNSNNEINDINNNNLSLTESKKTNKKNKLMNKTMSEANFNMDLNMNIDTESEKDFIKTDKYNIYKKIKRKKNNFNKEEYKNRNINNVKNNFREKEKNIVVNISNNTNSFMNKNKNSHSVSSIRARIKSKKF